MAQHLLHALSQDPRFAGAKLGYTVRSGTKVLPASDAASTSTPPMSPFIVTDLAADADGLKAAFSTFRSD